MNTKRIETWVWLLIYAGMILLGLGIATQRIDAVVGWPMIVVGGVLIAIGVLMIWLRSRMRGGAN